MEETDLHNLLTLLDRWGVQYEIDDDFPTVVVGGVFTHGDKIDGYPGFYTAFQFDHDGRFVKMGAWE